MEHALGMAVSCTYRCARYVAPFGKRCKKQYNFLATSSWIRGVFATRRCPGNLHLPLTNKRIKSPAPTPSLWDNVLLNAHALAKQTG